MPASMILNLQRNTPLKFYGIGVFLTIALTFPPSAIGQDAVTAPTHFDPRERTVLPDISDRQRIRFLTTTNFPPFNFLDQYGRLAGFHIDLVRAICEELNVEDACQIQALPFDELQRTLEAGRAEAIIAGLAVTDESRQRYRFTRSFLKLPARFLDKKEEGSDMAREAVEVLGADSRVGVLDGSAHEAMLRAYFPDVQPVTFSRASFMFDALKFEHLDAVFGDGVQLSFWLGSEDADDCCRFLDGPFFSERFLGNGLAIAVEPENAELVEAFDYALLALSNNGRLADIYLRYFPNAPLR